MLISLMWEYHRSFCLLCRSQTETVNYTPPPVPKAHTGPVMYPGCRSADPHLDFCLFMLTTSCTLMPAPVWQFLEMSRSFLAWPNWTLAELLEWDAYTMPLERHRSKYITMPTKSSGGLEQCIKAWAFQSACEDFLLPLWRRSLIWSVHIRKEEKFLL